MDWHLVAEVGIAAVSALGAFFGVRQSVAVLDEKIKGFEQRLTDNVTALHKRIDDWGK